MVDLNAVALFVQVVRAGSFAEAGRRLGTPSNTVSRRVQELEEELGTRLLQRTTRKLTLTGAGEAFHVRCASAIDGLVDAEQELLSGSREPSGLVRVAAAADFFDFFSIDWVADFLTANPRVRLDFVLSDAKSDLIEDRIDVAFRGGTLSDSGYVGRQLFATPGDHLVASPGYLAARGMPSGLQDLRDHDCVTAGHAAGNVIWELTGPDGTIEVVEVAGRFMGNTAQSLRRASLAGLGIALLPTIMTSLDVSTGLLTPVLPRYRRSARGLSVLYPSRRHLLPAISAFIELVVDKLGDLVATSESNATARTDASSTAPTD